MADDDGHQDRLLAGGGMRFGCWSSPGPVAGLAFAVGHGDDPDAVVQEEIDDDVGEVLDQIAAGGVAPQRLSGVENLSLPQYAVSVMLLLLDQKAPLREDADGVWRIAGTRVTLDIVVTAFEDGATAEEIAQQYPTLALADVYAVIGYYLRQREQVQVYLQERQQRSEVVRAENEARASSAGIRSRLLARQTK